MFFEYQRGLYFIYTTIPFETVAYDFDRNLVGQTVRTDPRVDWNWGDIRGGTSPRVWVIVTIAFFHSSLFDRGKFVYYGGLFTFAPKIPFRIEQFSPKPLLSGHFDRLRNKLVIYPGGAICEDKWHIACGVGDARCAIYSFERDEVENHVLNSI